MLAKCVCQMCSCGRHRCPRKKEGTWAKRKDYKNGGFSSEYQSVYVPRDYQTRRGVLRPKRGSGLENLGYGDAGSKTAPKSNYTMEFVVHEVSPRKCLPRPDYTPPNETMDLVTIYDQDFLKKDCSRSEPIRPKSEYYRPDGKFTTKTVHQLTYVSYNQDEMQRCRSLPIKLPDELVNDGNSKFEAISTVQADYTKFKDTARVQLIKPKQNDKVLSKFDGNTSYNQDFQPKSPVSRTLRKKNDYTPKNVRFEGVTTFTADFKPHPDHTRQPCFKPPRRGPTFVGNKTPFDGRTIQSMAYKEWVISKPEKPDWGKRQDYEKPEIKMDCVSMYSNDYKEIKDAVPSHPIIPRREDHPLRNKDPMDVSSHYTQNFVKWEGVSRPASFKIVQEYKEPVEKFECKSIQSSHYKGEYAPRADIRRPPRQTSTDVKKPIEGSTIYTDTYEGKQPNRCPVQDFSKDESSNVLKASNFELVHLKNGHQFYREAEKSVENTQVDNTIDKPAE